MPKFKRISVAEARQMLIGKKLSYTYAKNEDLKTISIENVKYIKGVFDVYGIDDKGEFKILSFGGNAIVWLSEHKEFEAFTNSEVRPFYAKYVLTD